MSDTELQSPLAIGEIEQGPSKFDQFLERNQKALLAGGVALVVLVAGVIVFKGIEQNKQQAAGAQLIGASEGAQYATVVEDYAGTSAAGSALLILSDKQWDEGKLTESVESLKSFLKDYEGHPSYSLALVKIGTRFTANEQNELADEYFRKAIATDDVTVAPLAQLLLADTKMEQGDMEAAQELLTEANKMSESDLGALKPIITNRLNTAKSPQPQVITPKETIPEEAPALIQEKEAVEVPVVIDSVEGE